MIEFIEELHMYIVDGIIVPSVTQIIKSNFKDMYAFVSDTRLERASGKGIEVHRAIERYEKDGEETDLIELRNYKFLKSHYKWDVIDCEKPITYFENGKPIWAGTLDLLVKINGKLAIADIKRTSAVNKDYLYYQLNFYRKALEQMEGVKIEELYCLHLRERRRKLIRIPIGEKYLDTLWESYKKEQEDE